MDIERDPKELRRAFLQVGMVLVGVYLFMWVMADLVGLMPVNAYPG